MSADINGEIYFGGRLNERNGFIQRTGVGLGDYSCSFRNAEQNFTNIMVFKFIEEQTKTIKKNVDDYIMISNAINELKWINRTN